MMTTDPRYEPISASFSSSVSTTKLSLGCGDCVIVISRVSFWLDALSSGRVNCISVQNSSEFLRSYSIISKWFWVIHLHPFSVFACYWRTRDLCQRSSQTFHWRSTTLHKPRTLQWLHNTENKRTTLQFKFIKVSISWPLRAYHTEPKWFHHVDTMLADFCIIWTPTHKKWSIDVIEHFL